MGSKYDDYWAAQLPQIRAQVQAAASAGLATMCVLDLTRLGARQSWHGTADVLGQETAGSSGAHATSLGKTVAASGICRPWPGHAFRFTISAAGDMLTITATTDHRRPEGGPAPGPGSQPRPAPQDDRRQPGPAQPGHLLTTDGGRQSDADEFYRILDQLAARLGGPRLLRECTGRSGCPPQGLYFFDENGENRADGAGRVVRVGTHALTATSKATLWGRLRQHRGHLAGSDPGGGDHRASVFRRHVGAALIRRDGLPDDLLASGLTATGRPASAPARRPASSVRPAATSAPCRSCGSAFPAEPTAATSRATASHCSPALLTGQTSPVPAGSAATPNDPRSASQACGTSTTSPATTTQPSSTG